VVDSGGKMKEKQNDIKALFPRIKDIRDEDLRSKVANVWIKAWEMSHCDRIEKCSVWPPEKAKIELSNVEHTNQVVECAIAVAKIVEQTQQIKINLDYLIAAAILHDVDKIVMFHEETGRLSSFGQLFAHTTLGISLALEQALPLEIVHAIGTHSPNYSKNSPKTPEALILSHVDTMMMLNWLMFKKVDISFKIDNGK
jgi:putative nucleotidyltransferase with HDIG domain